VKPILAGISRRLRVLRANIFFSFRNGNTCRNSKPRLFWFGFERAQLYRLRETSRFVSGYAFRQTAFFRSLFSRAATRFANTGV